MSSLQHVYRRGHVFWWRRVLRLSGGRRLNIRISLKTVDRSAARNLGAAMTAATGGVLAMLDQKARMADSRPTQQELQAIAKAADGELLSDLCTEQRSSPSMSSLHSVNNRALVDYYQRLANLGGHASLLPNEESRLREEDGWDEVRLEDLRTIIQLREQEGKTRFDHGNRPPSARAGLSAHGYAPLDGGTGALPSLSGRPHRR